MNLSFFVRRDLAGYKAVKSVEIVDVPTQELHREDIKERTTEKVGDLSSRYKNRYLP